MNQIKIEPEIEAKLDYVCAYGYNFPARNPGLRITAETRWNKPGETKRENDEAESQDHPDA